MDRKKVIIWSTIGVVSALAITFTILGIRKAVRKKREAEAKKEKEEMNKLKLEESAKESEAPKEQVKQGTKVTPTRDINRALNNNYQDLVGKVLYPALKSSNAEQGHLGAEGFSNVRSTPEVNNSQGIWDLGQTNFLYKVDAGTPIGTVTGEQNDNMSPPLRWFKVKLNKPYDGWFGDYTEGWVRGDTVTFKSYTKSASFEGEGKFVEKYKTDYPLGSDVFPHPNWMLPNSEEPICQAYDIDDVIMDL
jgi:hypothetical protein